MSNQKTIDKNLSNSKSNIEDKLAISNSVHNSENKIGQVSDPRIVPEIEIYGYVNSDFSNSRDFDSLDSISSKKSIEFTTKESNPFRELPKVFRKFDSSIINTLNTINSLEDIITEEYNYFLFKSNDKNIEYYVCGINYKLIMNFSTRSQILSEDILIEEANNIGYLLNHDMNNVDLVEYRFNDNDELDVKELTDHKLDIWNDEYNELMDTISISGWIMFCVAIFVGIIIPIIGLLLLFICALVCIGSFSIGPYYRKKSGIELHNIKSFNNSEDSLNLNIDNIKNLKNESDNSNNREQVLVNVEDNYIRCKDKNIAWKISESSHNLYTKEATDFFIDLGYDEPQKKFKSYIIPSDSHKDTSHKTLESECGDWLLVAKNLDK